VAKLTAVVNGRTVEVTGITPAHLMVKLMALESITRCTDAAHRCNRVAIRSGR
jgi:hypothetical protein